MLRTAALTAVSLILLAGCATRDGESGNADAPTIMEFIQSQGNLTTLASALKTAGLGPTLGSPGAFTLFAPTDEAFDALPEGVVDGLFEVSNREMLVNMMTYHIVPGSEKAAMLRERESVLTLNGREAAVLMSASGDLFVAGASIDVADIVVSNGVVHVIDTVLLPQDESGRGTEQPASEYSDDAQTEHASPVDASGGDGGPMDVFGESASSVSGSM